VSRPRILIVDDDHFLRDTLGRVFDDDHDVLLATSGQEAVRVIEEERQIDVLVTDFDLGDGVDGLDVATAYRGKFPTSPVVLITGQSLLHPRIQAVMRDRWARALEKPFTPAEIQAAVRSLLAEPH
jgi:CheY-like chemotaxis protein